MRRFTVLAPGPECGVCERAEPTGVWTHRVRGVTSQYLFMGGGSHLSVVARAARGTLLFASIRHLRRRRWIISGNGRCHRSSCTHSSCTHSSCRWMRLRM